MEKEEALSQYGFSPVQIKGLLKIFGSGQQGHNGIKQPAYDWKQLAHKESQQKDSELKVEFKNVELRLQSEIHGVKIEIEKLRVEGKEVESRLQAEINEVKIEIEKLRAESKEVESRLQVEIKWS